MIALFLLLACEPSEPCAGGSMLEGPSGLELTRAEHPEGWGEPECFACHAEAVLHRTGCTPGVDLEEVRAEVAAGGEDACAACHGENGLEPGDSEVTP